MPGLRLTIPQAARLWGLGSPIVRGVVDALVRSAFLRWTATGRRAGRQRCDTASGRGDRHFCRLDAVAYIRV